MLYGQFAALVCVLLEVRTAQFAVPATVKQPHCVPQIIPDQPAHPVILQEIVRELHADGSRHRIMASGHLLPEDVRASS